MQVSKGEKILTVGVAEKEGVFAVSLCNVDSSGKKTGAILAPQYARTLAKKLNEAADIAEAYMQKTDATAH